MAEKRKILIVIDANSLIHRAYHALPPLTTPKGEAVNAVYGFFLIFFKILKEFKPEYIAAAFDAPGPTERKKKFEEYKAKRQKAPDELYGQIPKIQEALETLGVPYYAKEGFEADDIIGTIANTIPKRQAYPQVEVLMISSDMDLVQLINERTRLYYAKGSQQAALYDRAAVRKKFGGLGPERITDYKALRGDPSDNIPGVTGIGEKTAIELLNEFGSLDNLYKLLAAGELGGRVKPRTAQLLCDYKEQAFLSRQLATIEKKVPIEIRLDDLRWNEDASKIQEILERFGFRSLVQRQETIYEKIEQLYRERVLPRQIYELEKRLVPVVRKMEERGIKIDRKYFQELQREMEQALARLRGNIHATAGKEFNVNSTQQLSEVLFKDLALPVKGLKKTPKGVISTASPELEKLAGVHPIIEDVLRHREIQKLLTTYARPLPLLADEKDRVHTHFDQLGTATGRISSSEPNLQNIPNQGEWGKRIRRGFVAEKGFSLVSFDYSQMELRIAAHLSGDSTMQKFFLEGADIHTMTASSVFGVPSKDISPEMRFRAKALNFGVLYGMGAHGFARSAGIPLEEARDFIEQYFARFPGVYAFMEKTKEFARTHGYVETMFGRRRYLPDANSSTPQLRAAAERMAQNHPIQGSLADIVKMAMVKIQENLGFSEEDTRMLLQIHDELLFEIADDKVEERGRSIKELMEHITPLVVPLQVDVRKGKNWDDVEKVLLPSSLVPKSEIG
ncbi:MAG: hypothetical protein A3J30_01800 [Candidatus Wildermuthbacteria bacterium RIFCSPLOWO2_02_FULL_47_9c]|uniref:DNA-directed DNA polymerase n=2 Tax=Parcubacteria group TaxID=1794811 RepID=A0A837IQ86_9BACT|nr:MAG: polymerase I, thermostable protein [Candidatus Yanofskybacteria bacterium GW2011_GWC1_48_11]KKW03951.1 MAG: polymerase I, thermostable protein [Parcubacteria group bacterium GW2011_GWB1_49_12]KKW08703.1 MAG: polymerase I, thermostable protein [Parcubacteria group bacterium GW2011_GWA1_49_26]OHA61652.1 MAG: hypothetical protein A2109_02825 [Candidatus Wildermuthbacteria bacterium GWA1_49_26]OHA65370.1 MAG: hypothetical protein A2674_00990 [Candidatus Wildermuthbacteria bacterium RIFCSPHI